MIISKMEREELDVLENNISFYKSRSKRKRIAELNTRLKMLKNNLDFDKDCSEYYKIREQEEKKALKKYLHSVGIDSQKKLLLLINKHKRLFKISLILMIIGVAEIITKGMISGLVGHIVFNTSSLITIDIATSAGAISIVLFKLVFHLCTPIWLFCAIYEYKSYKKYES